MDVLEPIFDSQRPIIDAVRAGMRATMAENERLDFPDFCRNRLRIIDKSGRDVAFALNPIQEKYRLAKSIVRRQGRPLRFLILKHRQGGITTYEQAASYEMTARNDNRRVLTMANSRDKTSEIFLMVEHFHAHDPMAPVRHGTGNSYRFVFPGRNSRFIFGTAGARTSGRAGTYQRVHWSEVAWSCLGGDQIDKQRQVLAGVTQAAGTNEVVLETTANSFELFHELWEDSKKGKNDWSRIFFRWFDDPTCTRPMTDAEEEKRIMASLTEREADLVSTHGLTPGQIKWRRAGIRELGPLFAQENPEDDVTAFLVSGTCRFNKTACRAVLEQLPDYIHDPATAGVIVREVPGGMYVEWEAPVKDDEYVIGVDTSEGVEGSHPNGVGVLHRSSGRQCASVHGLFPPSVLAEWSVKLHRRYNDALLGIERQNHGHAVILAVIGMGVGGERALYHYAPGRPGWSTDVQTRPVMIDDMAEAIYDSRKDEVVGHSWIRDRQMLSEAMTFTRQGQRWEASPGACDDSLFKWMIARMMRRVPRRGTTIREVEY